MSDLDRLVAELTTMRHRLHAAPEISGKEEDTARMVAEFLATCGPEEILTNLGGHGVAALFGPGDGPRVMLRCELDALPLPEAPGSPWPSENAGAAHKCGHDGHMAILLGVARRLQATGPLPGQAILLFQPAEETGTGAAALLEDPRFRGLDPNWVFALHNLPGHPAWSVLTRPGAFAAGSCGVRIVLDGATSHAAYPEQGQSPDRAMAEGVNGLIAMNQTDERNPIDKRNPIEGKGLALVTVTHARLGEPAFGITPGQAEILATLRSDSQETLAALKAQARALAEEISRKYGLAHQLTYEDEFPVTMNDPVATALIEEAAVELDLAFRSPAESPFRWSEDFGFLSRWRPGAMFGLGAGTDHPVLHGPDYDFNDDLILPGMMMMEKILRRALQR